MTKTEQETIITFNEAEACAEIYTHNKALQKRLTLYAYDHPDECESIRTEHDFGGMTFRVSKYWVKITPLTKRNFTDEERQKRIDSIRHARNKRKNAVLVENP